MFPTRIHAISAKIFSRTLTTIHGSYDSGKNAWSSKRDKESYTYSDQRQFSKDNRRVYTQRPSFRDRSYIREKKEPTYGNYEGDHLYGIAPVKLALLSNRRKISELLVQSSIELNKKKDGGALDILQLAETMGIETRELSKHDLNLLTNNRPHQGFVLRAEPLTFQKNIHLEKSTECECVLALDEVWDPQNFGALLRTCHFLGVSKVVVCAKNSAPLSPAVSKASAGAMELMDNIYATDNMMKFLDKAREENWQIVGTALTSDSIDLEALEISQPTILVLGNEGHGIRTNILRRCTQLVRIGGSDGKNAAISPELVDSLNVSVTGGIILHHLLRRLH